MLGFRGASRYFDDALPRRLRARVPRAAPGARGDGAHQRERDDPVLPHRRRGRARAATRWRATDCARGEHGLELYVMCEIPNNVLLVERVRASIFDGFSIGSNDLTQLVARRRPRLRDPRRRSSTNATRPCRTRSIARSSTARTPPAGQIGICGQAPSDHPEIAELLVRAGIDSLSLSADVAVQTRLRVAELERTIGVSPRQEEKP